jgi:hypothetical protein
MEETHRDKDRNDSHDQQDDEPQMIQKILKHELPRCWWTMGMYCML